MIGRILLAVDDSPGGLAAARAAISLAASEHAALRTLHVLVDGELEQALRSLATHPDVQDRRTSGTSTLLEHVARLAHASGVAVQTVSRTGTPGRCILDEAHAWQPDVIVIARAARHTTGHPYVGSQTRHVLEFADQPVLVVPQASPRAGPGR